MKFLCLILFTKPGQATNRICPSSSPKKWNLRQMRPTATLLVSLSHRSCVCIGALTQLYFRLSFQKPLTLFRVFLNVCVLVGLEGKPRKPLEVAHPLNWETSRDRIRERLSVLFPIKAAPVLPLHGCH